MLQRKLTYLLCGICFLQIGVSSAIASPNDLRGTSHDIINSFVIRYIVAEDGSGNFNTVQMALNAINSNEGKHIIFIKNGIYNEKLFIVKNNVCLIEKIKIVQESSLLNLEATGNSITRMIMGRQ